MGIDSISADRWPEQGNFLGARVQVCFHYDTSRLFDGIVLRDDAEEPGRMIIQLDNGRVVLSTECQWSPRRRSESDVDGADQVG